MPPSFQHLILTKFNLRRQSSGDVNEREWLTKRFRLFVDYCFPSVRNQTNQNFKWLVFFDTGLPEEFKVIINSLAAEWDLLIPVYLDGQARADIRRIAAMHVQAPYCISTRLDNDDMLSIHFVDVIQSQFDSQKRLLVNVLHGYCYSFSHQRFFEVKNKLANPFLSFIESTNGGLKTAFLGKHNKMKKFKKVLNLDASLWCFLIHDSNAVNTVSGRPLRIERLPDFEYKPTLMSSSDISFSLMAQSMKYRLGVLFSKLQILSVFNKLD